MGRVLQSPEITELTRPVDLSARVIYFPVRHHSPACAHHVRKLILQIRPDAVLVEGPRDATAAIPLLLSPQTRMPVAIYTTYVQRLPDDQPHRHAAYYPLCDYSPEIVALKTAAEVGAQARFIDLTFPEMIVAEHGQGDERGARNLQSERHLRQSRFLKLACQRAGARDPDDLWDSLFEVDYQRLETPDFIRNVLAFCALARCDCPPDHLEADGTLSRESAMAHAIAQEKGRVIVVTGGLHSVALPDTPGKAPEKVNVKPTDALVVLTRYGFEQLDRLNGYSSGMPSPEYYQRLWEGRKVADLFVELGREARKRGQEISVADEIAALDQCRRLAQMRGHPMPSREDLLDGVRSSYVKGDADGEGLAVLAIARQLLAGERVGAVPDDAGQPPLVADFRNTASRLGIDLDRIRAAESHLDLYRRVNHREISRFFHRLRFLDVPFAELVAGPDFVSGKDLERIQEVWKYHWSPECESRLIERSLYGSSLEEAALAMLLERFADNEKKGEGRRSDLAAQLLLEACRMGLHRHVDDLLLRTGRLIAEDQSFPSLVRAMDSVLMLQVSREPLEAHDLDGIGELASNACERSCYLIPGLANTPEAEEQEVLQSLVSLSHCMEPMGDDAQRRGLRDAALRDLAAAVAGNPAIRGCAMGLLYGDGQLDAADLAMAFRGHLQGGDGTGDAGAAFLRGLLQSARSAVWQVPQIIADLHAALGAMEESRFVHQLPLLRLAFSNLTPRETDQVARLVAGEAGVEKLEIASSSRFSTADMLVAVEVERAVAASLERDGLRNWVTYGGVT